MKPFFLILIFGLHSFYGIKGVIAGSTVIGNYCTESIYCAGYPDTSYCKYVPGSQYKKCQCLNDGFIPRRDLLGCLLIRNDIGDECLEPQQCQKGALKELSNCTDSTCQCLPNAVKASFIPECLLKATAIYENCKATEQCADLGNGAVCVAEKCACDEAISVPRADNSICLPIADVIEFPCEQSDQCQKGVPGQLSECKEGKCACIDGASNPIGNNVCVPYCGLGCNCENHEQCTESLGPYAECNSEKKCACQSIAVTNWDFSQCLLKATLIGQDCLESPQCTEGVPGQYSNCIEGKCQCTEEAIVIPGDNVCRKAAAYVGDPCKADLQCTANIGEWSQCASQVCVCKPGSSASEDGKLCVPNQTSKLIGQPCESNNECSGGSTCSSTNICACRLESVSSKDFTKCLPIINYLGVACEESQQCQDGTPGEYSTCTNGTCACLSAAVSIGQDDKCRVKAVVVGDSCERTEQCVPNLGNSLCINKRCICGYSSVPSADKLNCLPTKIKPF